MSLHRVLRLADIQLPSEATLVIFDQIIKRENQKWLQKFPYQYAVKGGETLKDLRDFPKHVENLLKRWPSGPLKEISVVALGGGSVGDFAGFFASVIKRGVNLIHIPTTWLAAVDSAHGGKTALNVGQFKNQVGTFHQSKNIYLVRDLLIANPFKNFADAYGEIVKTGLIAGGSLCRKIQTGLEPQQVFELLPQIVATKMKIVRRDPYEKSGHRHILNLGHTLGHVFELQCGLGHGRAVALGTWFSLNWSQHRFADKALGQVIRNLDSIGPLFPTQKDFIKYLHEIPNLHQSLRADKKGVGENTVRFVFVRSPGKLLIEVISFNDIDREIKRQSCDQSEPRQTKRTRSSAATLRGR